MDCWLELFPGLRYNIMEITNRRFAHRFVSLLLFLVIATRALPIISQSGPALPATCATGDIFTYTGVNPEIIVRCTSTNIWALIPGTKTIIAIPNNTFFDVLTITVPNISTGGLIEVTLSGSLGSGGAIGPYEATTGRTVLIAVTRTAGFNTDATIVNVANTIDARVAGSATISQTTQLSAIIGGATATQMFTLQYRIARGSGASTNHIVSIINRFTSPAPVVIRVQ